MGIFMCKSWIRPRKKQSNNNNTEIQSKSIFMWVWSVTLFNNFLANLLCALRVPAGAIKPPTKRTKVDNASESMWFQQFKCKIVPQTWLMTRTAHRHRNWSFPSCSHNQALFCVRRLSAGKFVSTNALQNAWRSQCTKRERTRKNQTMRMCTAKLFQHSTNRF